MLSIKIKYIYFNSVINFRKVTHFWLCLLETQVPKYKTEKMRGEFLNRMLASQVQTISILVGQLILLYTVRNGCFSGGLLPNTNKNL